MSTPFPGMDPYLEQPELWNQVHNRLIIAIADALTPQIVPNYHVSIEERVYTSVDDLVLVGVADVAVASKTSKQTRATTTLKQAEPAKVRVPMPEEVTERFLEIKSTRTGEVVTVIEVLSPKNKRSKDGRQAYEKKRVNIFASNTNLVEIDLLRAGEPMLIFGGAKDDYYILVSRGYHRPDADLYTFTVRDVVPAFPVPLKQGDIEPIVDLQQLLRDIYERARFDLVIDYSQPPKPPLSKEDAAWAWEILGSS
ncbi:MAG: DUF4058 family protein [Calothrix sp. C42_A2020_038]|nr:DUF4058 family protein [Calothrix sp. C42_A2020_038]